MGKRKLLGVDTKSKTMKNIFVALRIPHFQWRIEV